MSGWVPSIARGLWVLGTEWIPRLQSMSSAHLVSHSWISLPPWYFLPVKSPNHPELGGWVFPVPRSQQRTSVSTSGGTEPRTRVNTTKVCANFYRENCRQRDFKEHSSYFPVPFASHKPVTFPASQSHFREANLSIPAWPLSL